MSSSIFYPLILKNLNAPWADVLHLGIPVNFKHKQILAVDDKYNAEGLYYILDGCVRLSYIASEGQERVLFFLGGGTLFNEIPAISEGSACIFTPVAPTKTIYFKKSIVTSESFISEHPKIMLNWVESISFKSGCLFRQLCNTGLFDVFTNVCRMLYAMTIYQKEGNKIVPHLSHQDCAALLGIHRGSLHKAMTRLKDEGVIKSYSRNELVVLNMEQLWLYAKE